MAENVASNSYRTVRDGDGHNFMLSNNRFPMTCDTIAYMNGNVAGDFSRFMNTSQWKEDFDAKFRGLILSIPGVKNISDEFIDDEKTKLQMVHIEKEDDVEWEDIVPLIQEKMKIFDFFVQKPM